MDRRKRGSTCDDELALLKAAAWAWYQHGSGNEGKPSREFDLAKPSRKPRPSRYKLEAAASAAATGGTRDEDPPRSPAHSEISLFDSYEIDRITRHLERLMVSSRGGGGGAMSTAHRAIGRWSRRKHPPTPPGSGASAGKSPCKVSGFWFRHAVRLCGLTPVLVRGRPPGFRQ